MAPCAQASVHGLTLADAAYWTVHILRSRNVAVSELRIRNDPLIANTDGAPPASLPALVLQA